MYSRAILQLGRTVFGIMLNSSRFLPDGSQTDRHNRNGRRAITMPSKHFNAVNRSISSGKKHPNELAFLGGMARKGGKVDVTNNLILIKGKL